MINGATLIDFAIENITGSYAANRFRIVFFKPATTLPVSLVSLKAIRKNNNINVEWITEGEVNIIQYNVEHSTDNSNYTTLSVIPPSISSSASKKYIYMDTAPADGFNYYRIKAFNKDGNQLSTPVVKVIFKNENQGIVVTQNPVAQGLISLQFNAMQAGKYSVSLLSNSGQQMLRKVIEHEFATQKEIVNVNKILARGAYILKIGFPNGKTLSKSVVY